MTRAVDHIDVGDGVAVAAKQGGQKAVQRVEVRQRQESVAAKHLQAAAGVARAVVQDRAAHAVCDARLKLLVGAETANALGRVYLESGDLENAFKWYQTGYETSRRQPKLSADQIDLWNLRWAHAQARIAARKGNLQEARAQTAVVKALLDKGTNEDQRIQYPYLAGYVALYAKDYQTAIAELQKADQRDPFILMLIAQAYEKSGDMARARECYSQVLASNAHNPNNAFARPLARKKIAVR